MLMWMSKMFVLFLSIFIIYGCTNSFQNLQNAYNNGKYLQAAKYAIEGMRSPDLKPQVVSYMQAHGNRILEKAILHGKQMMDYTPNEQTIQYFQAFKLVLEEMEMLDMPVKDLKQYKIQVMDFLDEAIENFVKYEYELGIKSFKRKFYRKAEKNFANVLKYFHEYKKATKYVEDSYKLACRTLSFSPFYKPTDFVTQVIGETLVNVFSGGKSKAGVIKDKVVIGGIDVIDTFNSKTLYFFNKNKSKYLSVTMSTSDENVDHTNYYMDGVLDVREQVDKYNTVSEGVEHLNISYEVNIKVKAGVFLTANDQEVRTIDFTESAHKIFIFPSIIEGYYPKNNVVQSAVNKATSRLVREVLNVIDKDMDPYEYTVSH